MIKYALTPVQFGLIYQKVAEAIQKNPIPDAILHKGNGPAERKIHDWEKDVRSFYETYKSQLPNEDVFWDMVDNAVSDFLSLEVEICVIHDWENVDGEVSPICQPQKCTACGETRSLDKVF